MSSLLVVVLVVLVMFSILFLLGIKYNPFYYSHGIMRIQRSQKESNLFYQIRRRTQKTLISGRTIGPFSFSIFIPGKKFPGKNYWYNIQSKTAQ